MASQQVEETTSLVSLPAELISEILSRLPAKSLIRFRCISKSWNSLLCDPLFVKRHLHMSSLDPNFAHHTIIISTIFEPWSLQSCSIHSLFFDLFDRALDLTPPLSDPHFQFEIVGSCNGLICTTSEIHHQRSICVWNPCTRKTNIFPCTRPIRSMCVFGFGYDSSIDNYKVVRLACNGSVDDTRKNEVEVCTLGANIWRRIADFPYDWVLSEKGLFVGGALHWAATCRPDSDSGWLIVALDLAEEIYREVPQPDLYDSAYEGRYRKMELVAVGGYLCVVCGYSESHSDIWLMKEYGNCGSWTKLVSIPLPGWAFPLSTLRPICFSEKGDFLVTLRDVDSMLLLYSSKEGSFRHVTIDALAVHFGACLDLNSHIDSLVSPYARDQIEGQRPY